MLTRLIPEVGHWYRDRSDGHLFQVVALDDHVGTIEVQHSDGDLDEIEMDTWFALGLDAATAPEDLRGSGDPLDPEEREYAIAGEGWEPNLPREVCAIADSIDDRADYNEIESDPDDKRH